MTRTCDLVTVPPKEDTGAERDIVSRGRLTVDAEVDEGITRVQLNLACAP